MSMFAARIATRSSSFHGRTTIDTHNLLLLQAADRLERLAARTTRGDWQVHGLLASRPEVIARHLDGGDNGTQHVAEARSATAAWIATMSPALAAPLVIWLRSAGRSTSPAAEAVDLARALLDRLPAEHG